MKVLIFEGIATSGKSTSISQLKKALPKLKVIVSEESETHIPIMKDTANKHIDFFEKLINRLVSEGPDLLIFDRLYLTQAFRAKCKINDYSEIEELLAKYSPLIIFLKVNDDAIEDRISKASKHRGSDYFRSRDETPEERAQYYIDQQKYQLELLEHSTLPHTIINTTDHDYKKVVQEALTSTNKK